MDAKEVKRILILLAQTFQTLSQVEEEEVLQKISSFDIINSDADGLSQMLLSTLKKDGE